MSSASKSAYMANNANRYPGARVTPPPTMNHSKLRGSIAKAPSATTAGNHDPSSRRASR